LVCLILSVRQAPRFGIKSDDMVDTFLLIIILAIIGARIYYVVFSWHDFQIIYWKYSKPDMAVSILWRVDRWNIGCDYYGKYKNKADRLYWFLIVYVPLGHAIGRWAILLIRKHSVQIQIYHGYVQWTTYHYLAQYVINMLHCLRFILLSYMKACNFHYLSDSIKLEKTLNNRVKQLLGTLSYMDGSFYHRRFAYRFTLCGKYWSESISNFIIRIGSLRICNIIYRFT